VRGYSGWQGAGVLRRFLLPALILATLVIPAATSASSSVRTSLTTSADLPSYVYFKAKGSHCRTVNNQFYASTSFLMGTRNSNGWHNWVTNFHVRIRLEHPGAGLQLGSPWHDIRWPGGGGLLQDHSYSRILNVSSDGYSPEQDWVVHIKLIWDRTVPQADAVQSLKFPLAKLACPTGLPVGSG
jgi:hypothetical protein